jgi:hypothetical protein
MLFFMNFAWPSSLPSGIGPWIEQHPEYMRLEVFGATHFEHAPSVVGIRKSVRNLVLATEKPNQRRARAASGCGYAAMKSNIGSGYLGGTRSCSSSKWFTAVSRWMVPSTTSVPREGETSTTLRLESPDSTWHGDLEVGR